MRTTSKAALTAAAFAATLAGAAVASSTADAKQVSRFKVRAWSGGAFTDDSTGAFSHCAASVVYKSGIRLLFSVDKNLKWRMGFAKTSWRLNKGDSYPVSYRIDRYRIHRGTAHAINKSLATVSLPGKQAPVFNQMRRGVMLSVATKTDVLKFRLNGSSRMLSSLLDCASKRSRGTGRGSNPFGGSSGGSNDQQNPFGASTNRSRNPFDA